MVFTSTVKADEKIQSIIDDTPANGIVELLDHTYEAEIVITKPVTIIGSDYTVISSCSDQPVITVKSNDVRLENVQVKRCDSEKPEDALDENPSISLTGTHIELSNVDVKGSGIGIQLDNVSQSRISGGSVHSNGAGNGIDIWESTDNIIENVQITDTLDGIYLERGSNNALIGNDIQHARYGMHLMYSDNVLMEDNQSHHNFTGAMIMESDRVKVFNNTFYANNSNVNSQGLLLFAAPETEVINNTIDGNRVGIFIEDAYENSLRNNHVTGNFTGVQFQNTENNEVRNNSFIGNVNDVQAVGGTSNQVTGNYWDGSLKLEDGSSGVSLFPFQAEPLYLLLTEDVSAYQLFFDSPSMKVIKAMFNVPSDSVMEDTLPLVHAPASLKTDEPTILSTLLTLLTGLCLTFLGLNLFKYRRIKNEIH
ncbi:right-handed parallel beta-helix repeat-containing protein [Gracilibacillus salinarum]|uniref:Right-handed parallel beta-helix repeat-containing protein n=1 Tax=Gracilibacillus salinarum TaxID=2932255 RepID=A0ABY4GIA9_9BACI|nr:NosD domain-containing protein [Gracilibacillus salinarum]UOQ84085.1 right-handed parallel beta-helix repeat-containing protein [Gracilibacillus salinarum]